MKRSSRGRGGRLRTPISATVAAAAAVPSSLTSTLAACSTSAGAQNAYQLSQLP